MVTVDSYKLDSVINAEQCARTTRYDTADHSSHWSDLTACAVGPLLALSNAVFGDYARALSIWFCFF